MLQYHRIKPQTLQLFKKLARLEILKETRLVGGTALALQYGHRSSIYLDFFGHFECDFDHMTQELKSIGDVKTISLTKNIRIYTVDGVKVDIVNYPYEWIDKEINHDGLVLATDKDIAAMKINAIMGRGSKKDFIDIYCLLQKYSLNKLLDWYLQKYIDGSEFRAILSLGYFDDADPQPSPELFIDAEWDDMKKFISKQLKAFTPHS